jgi:hypothetical protein
VSSIRFMTPDDPGVVEVITYDISEYAYEHFNFPRWEETSTGVRQPSTGHRQ